MYKIRGHTLLCLQGFRGKGYSDAFVSNMKNIHETLFSNPQTEVDVVIGPDDICFACPSLKGSACTLNGPGTEGEMVGKDNNVIELIGLYPKRRYRWGEILNRISQRLSSDIIKDLCSGCQWLPLGHCEKGIRLVADKSRGGSTDEDRAPLFRRHVCGNDRR